MKIWKPLIIDRYIMKKFIVSFFISILLIIGIVIIFDLSEKIDDFVKNEATLKEVIFDYYVHFVPYFMNMFSPLFVFITVIFFTSRLTANSEVIAILSGGVSYRRMMVPYLVSAAIISALSLGLNLYVIPRANEHRIAFEAKYVKRHNNYKSRDIHYQIAPGEFVYIGNFSSWNETCYQFTLETIEDNRVKSKLSAETAKWDSTFDGWHLRNYYIRDFSEGLMDKVETGTQKDTVIALKIEDFFRNEKTVETLPARKLNELIEVQKMRGDSAIMYSLIEKQRRVALPFSAFILTIIGVSLSTKKKRGGTGWNLGIGIGLAFTYILFLKFSEMFVYTNTLPPFVALWLPNVLFAVVAIVLYKMAPK